MTGKRGRAELSAAQYAAIAAFRRELRRFLAFSEAAAREAGLPAAQHQALLAIAGAGGSPSVGEVAASLRIAPHSAAGLVERMAVAGLVVKRRAAADRRRVELGLTAKARAVLRRLTAAHLRELEALAPALQRALEERPG